MSEETELPRHVGFIVDGNRRWAKQHGLPAYEGHLAGYNSLKDVLLETSRSGVNNKGKAAVWRPTGRQGGARGGGRAVAG